MKGTELCLIIYGAKDTVMTSLLEEADPVLAIMIPVVTIVTVPMR